MLEVLPQIFIPQAIAEDERLLGFHASLASPGEGNIPGFPSTPGNRCHILIETKFITAPANLAFELLKQQHTRKLYIIAKKYYTQERVDGHIDRNHLHRERPAPSSQRPTPPLLVHASQAHHTHQVSMSIISSKKLLYNTVITISTQIFATCLPHRFPCPFR